IFEPKADDELPRGTVSRAKATCPCCSITLPPDRVRAQLAEQHGGADVSFDSRGNRVSGAMLLAVVTLSPDEVGRSYRLANERDYKAVWKASKQLERLAAQPSPNGLSPVPDEPLPSIGTLGFRVQRYGMLHWHDLFTARQRVTLASIARITSLKQTDRLACSAFALGKLADLSNALCSWIPEVECPSAVFKLGRVKMAWDFIEGAPLRDSSGSYSVCVDNLAAGILSCITSTNCGQVSQAKAQSHPLPDDASAIVFTDPPYYDAIPYSDLSDFFLVWLKRALPGHPLLRDSFDPSNPLSPKDAEAVHDETKRVNGRPKDRTFFENTMAQAFAESRRVLKDDGIGSIVFAHKTTEGWEALLSGIIRGGWTITGSWPIATEMGHRLRARESAALATSVHLVCRPRADTAPVGDWGEALRELPNRVADWMEKLQVEGVRGADLVFACIGPALEIFSRFSKVETAEGREVTLAEYLEKVWEVVGRTALEHVLGTAAAVARNGAAGAVEEDARLTALFLWTLQSTDIDAENNGGDNDESDESDDDEEEEGSGKPTKGYSLIYDVVRRFAQPLGIHLEDWAGRIIEIKKGVVRLLSVGERAKQLFGEDGATAVADRIESDVRAARSAQMLLFPDAEAPPKVRGRARKTSAAGEVSDESLRTRREATTLDRVHAAMLLQASGRANALRALLKAEIDRGPDFLRLSNALSALYPRESEEKRLLDAMLLAVPR
ncbi:DNA methyltransferase, partial [cyanobacterium TDX16]